MTKIILKRTLTERWGTYEAGYSFDENQIVDITAQAIADFIENSVKGKMGVPVDGDLSIIEKKIGRKLVLEQEEAEIVDNTALPRGIDLDEEIAPTIDELKAAVKELGGINRGTPKRETLIKKIKGLKESTNQNQK